MRGVDGSRRLLTNCSKNGLCSFVTIQSLVVPGDYPVERVPSLCAIVLESSASEPVVIYPCSIHPCLVRRVWDVGRTQDLFSRVASEEINVDKIRLNKLGSS